MASFKQQTNGKWRYRIRYKQNGKFKEYSKSGFRLKSEAVAEANDMEQKLKKGHNVQDASMLISDYMETWLRLKKNTIKQSSYMVFENALDNHIIPQFGNVKLNELTRMDCIDWVAKLCKDYSINSVKTYTAPFINALDEAVYEFRLIDINPMKRIKYPKQEKRKVDIEFYEKDVLKKLLDCGANYTKYSKHKNFQYYVLTNLLAKSGLRLGEALALNWEDIDGTKITVNKTVYRTAGKDNITTPKTESSYRTIQLDTFSMSLLKRLQISKMEESMKTINGKLNTKVVFSDLNGNYLNQSNYRGYFRKICNKADIPVLSPHALRHSHAVHLLESGSNIKFVSDRLGHSTINMTANVYLHVSKKMEEESLAQYENYF